MLYFKTPAPSLITENIIKKEPVQCFLHPFVSLSSNQKLVNDDSSIVLRLI